MKRGDLIDLTLTAFADRGKSLGRAEDGRVVFVAGGVPGDRVAARVVQTKKRHAEARLETLVEPSGLRVAPRCRYFGTCGGCKWQHVDYDAQREMKRQSVEDALRRTGGFEDLPEVRPTLGSPRVYFYRNKMEFSFADERWRTWDELQLEKAERRRLDDAAEALAASEVPATDVPGEAHGDTYLDPPGPDALAANAAPASEAPARPPRPKEFALGLHAPGSFAKVLDLHECHLQSELSVALVNAVRALALAHGWTAYGQRSHEGLLRHLLIRHGEHTGETLVNLVTNDAGPDVVQAVAARLRAEFPSVTTFVHTVHTGLGPTALDARVETVFGPGVLHDRIGELTFEIAPAAFFQTNTRGAEGLYGVARALADLRPSDLLYDLYCGAGTISLFCAPHVRHVVGVELVPEAIANAHANALRNGIGNATFVAGDMLTVFTPAFVEEHGAPDVLLLDPPRAGVHPKVVAEIARLAPERIVYVSCNPQTQARDLALLRDASGDAYRLDAVQPVDMFPHTSHVETVVRLTRR